MRIVDMGMASHLDPETKKRKSVCGTQRYMAPEMKNKEFYNQSVDWYSLGKLILDCQVTSLPNANWSRLTTPCHWPTAHCPLPTAHCSLLTVHYPLLTSHCWLPTADRSSLIADRCLLTFRGVIRTPRVRSSGKPLVSSIWWTVY